MTALVPCPGCVRHVRRSETNCPFCARALSLAYLPARPMPTERLGRAALMAFTTLVASGSVGCTESHQLDGGVDAYLGAADAAYGGIDASFTPDVGRDAQSSDAAAGGCPDTAFVGMYGTPPPCPDR